MLNENTDVDDPTKSLKKRQKKSLEYAENAANMDSLLLLEPTIAQISQTSSTNSNDQNSSKSDEQFLKLRSILIDNGFDENYLTDLKNTLIELQDESHRLRAARNMGDFDINNVQRTLYTPEQKIKILEVYNTFQGNIVPSSSVFNFIRNIKGYEKVSSSVIYRWKQSPTELQPTPRSGRPISTEFEYEVVNEAVRIVAGELNMLKQSPVDNDDGETYYLSSKNDLLRAANVESRSGYDKSSGASKEMHTYRIMRLAAATVHDRFYEVGADDAIIVSREGLAESGGGMVQKWKHDKQTSHLAFSNKWIQSVLNRNDLHNWDIRGALSNPRETSHSATIVRSAAKTPSKNATSKISSKPLVLLRSPLVTVCSAGYSSVTNAVRATSEVVGKVSVVASAESSSNSGSVSASATVSHSAGAVSTSAMHPAPIALSAEQLNLVQQVWNAVVCQVKADKALLSPTPHHVKQGAFTAPSSSSSLVGVKRSHETNEINYHHMHNLQQQYESVDRLYQQSSGGGGAVSSASDPHQYNISDSEEDEEGEEPMVGIML